MHSFVDLYIFISVFLFPIIFYLFILEFATFVLNHPGRMAYKIFDARDKNALWIGQTEIENVSLYLKSTESPNVFFDKRKPENTV